MRSSQCCWVLIVLTFILCMSLEVQAQVHLYVSTFGSDSNSGNSTSSPFASLSKAASTIITLKNTVYTTNTTFFVNIFPGTYFLNSTVVIARPNRLNDQFSPVIWRPIPASNSGCKPFHLQHTSLNARGNVLQCNLTQAGIKSSQIIAFKKHGYVYGSPSSGNEIFFRGFAQTVARYPNKLSTQPVNDTRAILDQYMNVGKLNGTNQFYFNSTLCPNKDRWPLEKYPFAFGYWRYDWAEGTENLQSITSDGKITFVASEVPPFGLASKQRFFLVNFVSELDMPGEYVIQNEMVYYWPPSSIQNEDDVTISLADHLFSISSHGQVFDSLDMGCTRGSAISSLNNNYITVNNSIISNTGSIGVALEGCIGCKILNSEAYYVGQGAFKLNGGNRVNLLPSNSVAFNNIIHSFSRIGKTYRPAFSIAGVGITVTHNEIFNADHVAILFGGNDHELSYNKIYDVCKSTGDSGAIYRIRGPGFLGTTGVYLDDMFSSAAVIGNVFYDCYRGVIVGGGRHNQVFNNIFINNTIGVMADPRGLTWGDKDLENQMWNKLFAMPFNNTLWSSRYPELASILERNPFEPFANFIHYNLFTTSPSAMDIRQPYISLYSNYTNNTFNVPLTSFVNPTDLNFNLVPGNVYEANKELYNFAKIPFDEIGTVKKSRPPAPLPSPLPSPSSPVVKPSSSQTKPRASVSGVTQISPWNPVAILVYILLLSSLVLA
ncbi:hypothetical protein C9374_002252 [Naegleria lovaniensis]|uniref:Right handed beta helix domain-containing protein n=1 Tax=Naegleria lovaniensis TaxID=51637 RepID=A0AA88GUF7_NAELO|nr:uncharacterized protein C9374_002252 [Naegleria lovaniensis]KAG2386508.1 hypothetical protein C9374_002252 [Naegleria lovaniensis]